MIANDNSAPPSDRLDELHLTHPDMIAPGCRVTLDDKQFRVLKRYLDHIRTIGDVNFMLERCEDYRGFSDVGGYSVDYDNDGSGWQDDFVDLVMVQMTQSLGFRAGSILEEGYLIELSDIDQQVEEIKARVTERSRQRALDSVNEVSGIDHTFSPRAALSEGIPSGELTELKRDWIWTAARSGAPLQWIADQLDLPLAVVKEVIGEFGT